MADLTPEQMMAYKEWVESFKAEEAAKKLAENEGIAEKPLTTLGESARDSFEKIKEQVLQQKKLKETVSATPKSSAYSDIFGKKLAEDIVSQASKPSTVSTAEQAASVLMPGPDSPVVPVGKSYDPSELKRKAAETAARISSSGRLPGTINLPGPDEVTDLVPVKSELPSVSKATEQAIEAEFRNIPSFLEKATPYAKAASRGALTGLKGGVLSAATGGLYDEALASEAERVRSGKRDIPVPDRPGYVFRGSDIVKAGSETPVAPDLLPSMKDVFVKALAPEGSEAQKEAYANIKKTGLGSLIHGKEEIATDLDESPSTFQKAKNLLGAMFGPSTEKDALQTFASEKDKAEVERLIKEAATSSSIQPKDEDKQKIILPQKQNEVEEEEEEPKESGQYKPSVSETPGLKPKEEPSSLEKALAEASKKESEERTKYSDLLKEAVAKRDFTELAAQLGRAASMVGAGIGGTVQRGTVTKPVGEDIYKSMIETAGQPLSDLERRKTYETEERKTDPNSSESKAARAIMTQFGIKIPETATAAFLEKQFPFIERLTASREATAQRGEAARMHREEMRLRREELDQRQDQKQRDKLDVEYSKFAEKANAAYANPRSVVGKNEGVISSADKALSYIGSIDPDKATETQINEMARLVDSMLAQGAATVGGSKKVLESMETLKGDIGKIERYFGGSPTSARRGDFVKALMKNVSDIKEESQRQNRESLKQLILAHPNVVKNREIELENFLKTKNVLGPEETVNDLLKSGRASKPSSEGKKQAKTVSSAELKALVANKAQNPHNKSESEVANYLKSQGWSVDGY